MTKMPKWLDEALKPMLTELEQWKDSSPESEAAIRDWRKRIDAIFLSRGFGTPYQQRNRLVDVRNAIRAAYGPEHPALTIVRFDEQTWRQINDQHGSKPKQKPDMEPTTPTQATATNLPRSSDIKARLDQAKAKRNTIKASFDQERASLDQQQTRLSSLEASKLVPPAPGEVAPASAPSAISADEKVAAVAGHSKAKTSQPGFLSRWASRLGNLARRLTGRRQAGSSLPDSGNPAKARQTGSNPVVRPEASTDAPVAANAQEEAAAASPTPAANDEEIQRQLGEVMAEIQAIEERLNEMAIQIQSLDKEIAELEKQLAEAEAQETSTVEKTKVDLHTAQAVGQSAVAAAGQGDLPVRYSLAKHGDVRVVYYDRDAGAEAGFSLERDSSVRNCGRAYLVENAQGESFVVPAAFSENIVRPRDMVGTTCDTQEPVLSTDRIERFVPAVVQRQADGHWKVAHEGQTTCGLSPLLDPRYAENSTEVTIPPTAPESSVAEDGSVVVCETIGMVEAEVVNRYLTVLAKRLSDGEKLVLCGDDARLPSICPQECKVTDCGTMVFAEEVTVAYRLDAVRDPGTGKWVESVDHSMEEARAAVQAQAVAQVTNPEAPDASKARSRGR